MAVGRRVGSPVREAVVATAVAAVAAPAPVAAGIEGAYRTLADHTSDVVLEIDARGTLRWVSPSIGRVLGHDPHTLVGTPAEALWVPDEPALRQRVKTALDLHHRVDDIDCRVRTGDGGWRWMSAHVEPVTEGAGREAGCIVGIRDVHAAVVADRAHRTLSAGNAVLVRVDDEDALLQAMCQVAVDAGGYTFAWYGRPVDEAGQPVRAVTCTDGHRAYLDAIDVSSGDDRLSRGPVGRALRTGATARVDDLLADPRCGPWRAQMAAHGFRSAVAIPVRVGDDIDGAFAVYASEAQAFDEAAIEVLEDFGSQVGLGLARIRETTRLSVALSAQSVLLAAIDLADEAVVVADPTPRILYANDAAARVFGVPARDLVGRDPLDLGFASLPPGLAATLARHAERGEPWHGQISTVRADGSALVADSSVTPVAGADGTASAYVVVMRDITTERAREDALDREHQDRAVVLDILEHLRPSATVEETATEFCRAVEAIVGFHGAMVIMFQADGDLVTYAAGGPVPTGMERGSPIRVDDFEDLAARTRAGAWVLDFADPATATLLGEETFTAILALGATATAYAPIRWGGEPAGVLAVVNLTPGGYEALATRLPILAELGSFAGLLFGAQAERYSARESDRREIRAIIEERRFHPAFQPVIDAVSGAVEGYEALTRFDDGVRPDRRLARAHACGLGPQLERACARAALDAADAAGLAPATWIAVNFSPACVLDGTAAEVVAGAHRAVVIEITEHARIESYPALREAFRSTDARVAVDDAGAGFASLRHILELRPDIVKLDIGLVRGIDGDPARQAMAAGLCEFAEQTGTMLIAEGIETEAEAEAVRCLGVRYLQGYLLGRPGPLGVG